jgi:hypothetical protein
MGKKLGYWNNPINSNCTLQQSKNIPPSILQRTALVFCIETSLQRKSINVGAVNQPDKSQLARHFSLRQSAPTLAVISPAQPIYHNIQTYRIPLHTLRDTHTGKHLNLTLHKTTVATCFGHPQDWPKHVATNIYTVLLYFILYCVLCFLVMNNWVREQLHYIYWTFEVFKFSFFYIDTWSKWFLKVVDCG